MRHGVTYTVLHLIRKAEYVAWAPWHAKRRNQRNIEFLQQ
jgi:hypothetical protein